MTLMHLPWYVFFSYIIEILVILLCSMSVWRVMFHNDSNHRLKGWTRCIFHLLVLFSSCFSAPRLLMLNIFQYGANYETNGFKM
jgi:hypothetical protein